MLFISNKTINNIIKSDDFWFQIIDESCRRQMNYKVKKEKSKEFTQNKIIQLFEFKNKIVHSKKINIEKYFKKYISYISKYNYGILLYNSNNCKVQNAKIISDPRDLQLCQPTENNIVIEIVKIIDLPSSFESSTVKNNKKHA